LQFLQKPNNNLQKIKGGLFMSVTTIGKANFEKEVLQSDLPVIVDFWAPWCGYCRRLSPVVDQLDGAYEGRLVIGKINIDDEPELAEKYAVETIPTLMLFQKGKEPAVIIAPQSRGQVTEWLKENGVE
jgi:thioredoxin 1